MENRINELLEKYWEAETTVAEERELRDLLQKADGFQDEKALFQGLEVWGDLEPNLEKPKKSKMRKLAPVWLNWAASVAIVVGSIWAWQSVEQRKAEEQAYQEVMMAFALVQKNLKKGKAQMLPMNELKYLSTTNQLFDKNLDQ